MSTPSRKPDHRIIRQILDDVEAVTNGRFYEDPDPPQGPVEMFLARDGRQGYAFDALPIAQKVQVLSDYAELDRYEAAGISYRQLNQIVWNVIEGKPRAEWLDGTGLTERGNKRSLADLRSFRQTDRTQQHEQQRQYKPRDRGNGMER